MILTGREFYLSLLGVVLIAVGIGGYFRWREARTPPISFTPPTDEPKIEMRGSSANGAFTQPVITLRLEGQAPDAFISIREKGKIVQRIDRDGTIHPNYRRKFHLLERKMRRICACGCCTGDVREGKHSRSR